ncbi:hypothetical protein POM88_045915 [Heracleum sosnowskyi]|uniref:Uncharacterized protein n=1 Tax=Heracleum sosnowskyi TaxID=360622 RepID=A0AAD8M5F6_9APIA|nr:hypothetical protein POM88_045915 [Heracleum sosnowskyi]
MFFYQEKLCGHWIQSSARTMTLLYGLPNSRKVFSVSSYLHNDGGSDQIGGLSISIPNSDGGVVAVVELGGVLIAANLVHVIIGSFICSGLKTKSTANAGNTNRQIGDRV